MNRNAAHSTKLLQATPEEFEKLNVPFERRDRFISVNTPAEASTMLNVNDYLTSKNFLPRSGTTQKRTFHSSPSTSPFLSFSRYYDLGHVEISNLIQFRLLTSSETLKSACLLTDNKALSKEKDVIGFRFGKRGWTCSTCCNFNFLTRNKCNICDKKKNINNRKKGGKSNKSEGKTLQSCRLDNVSDPANQAGRLDNDTVV